MREFNHPKIGLIITASGVKKFEWATLSSMAGKAFVDAYAQHPNRVSVAIYDLSNNIGGPAGISGGEIAEWLNRQLAMTIFDE